jgi:hypothetical protein
MQHYQLRALRERQVISVTDLLAPSEVAAVIRAADIQSELEADGMEVWSGAILIHRHEDAGAN